MASFASTEELFAGRHFQAEIIVLCVRWYLSLKLSYRDLVRMITRARRRSCTGIRAGFNWCFERIYRIPFKIAALSERSTGAAS
jgi:hypothetical protein